MSYHRLTDVVNGPDKLYLIFELLGSDLLKHVKGWKERDSVLNLKLAKVWTRRLFPASPNVPADLCPLPKSAG